MGPPGCRPGGKLKHALQLQTPMICRISFSLSRRAGLAHVRKAVRGTRDWLKAISRPHRNSGATSGVRSLVTALCFSPRISGPGGEKHLKKIPRAKTRLSDLRNLRALGVLTLTWLSLCPRASVVSLLGLLCAQPRLCSEPNKEGSNQEGKARNNEKGPEDRGLGVETCFSAL